jgi:hypothetical protein
VELIRRGCRFIAAKPRFAHRRAVAQQHPAAAGASLQLRCVGLFPARSSIALTTGKWQCVGTRTWPFPNGSPNEAEHYS